MNTTTYIVAGGVLILILIGGYFGWQSWSARDAVGTEPTGGEQVQAQEVTIGTGDVAEPGMQVSVLYEGRFQNGTIFDSSAAHENKPLVFVLGAQGVVPGFQIGVNGMREGGARLFTIPPSLGYGSQEVKDAAGNVVIPANSTLVFAVQLVDVSLAAAQ